MAGMKGLGSLALLIITDGAGELGRKLAFVMFSSSWLAHRDRPGRRQVEQGIFKMEAHLRSSSLKIHGPRQEQEKEADEVQFAEQGLRGVRSPLRMAQKMGGLLG